jgi:hypothetical protein
MIDFTISFLQRRKDKIQDAQKLIMTITRDQFEDH